MFETVYLVNEITNERGFIGRFVGWSYNKNTAENLAVGKGYYGGMGHVEKAFTVSINGKMYVLKSDVPLSAPSDIDIEEEAKKSLKKKLAALHLSDAERQILISAKGDTNVI